MRSFIGWVFGGWYVCYAHDEGSFVEARGKIVFLII